ncbi:polyprotein P1 [Potato virus B]|uniref:polyprotein P1 n=5 Tax=Potato virus B TaxID=2340870 RepID=UPI001E281B83|nr:polyprotein P1 [Potato virus B]
MQIGQKTNPKQGIAPLPDTMDSAIVLPYCKYNNSLNLFFYQNTNSTINLDLFSYYSTFSNNLKKAKSFFYFLLDTVHPDFRNSTVKFSPTYIQGSSIFKKWKKSNGGITTISAYTALFSSFLVKGLGVNPYQDEWEPVLASWPTFGGSLLNACQNCHERMTEEREYRRLAEERKQLYLKELAAKKAAAARKAARAKRLAYRKRFYAVRKLVIEARVQLIARAYLQLQAKPVPPTSAELEEARNLYKEFQAYSLKYAQFVATKRYQRRMAQEERAEKLFREVEALLKEPLRTVEPAPKVARAAAREGRRQQLHGIRQGILESLNVSPGSKESSERAIVAVIAVAPHYPRLASSIVSFLQEHQVLLSKGFAPFGIFIDNICKLVRFYDEDQLIQSMSEIKDEARLQEATVVTSGELQLIEDAAQNSNVRASVFKRIAGKIKNCVSNAYSGAKQFCYDIGEAAAEGVFSVVMKCFHEMLKCVKQELGLAHEFIEMLIKKVRAWYDNLIKKIGDAMYTIGVSGIIALMFLLCQMLTYSINKLLGVPDPFFLMQIFSGLFFAYSMWDNKLLQGAMRGEFIALINEFMRNFFSHAQSSKKWRPTKADQEVLQRIEQGETSNIRSIPVVSGLIEAISAFGMGLCKFQSMSLLEVGKMAAALHQLRLGKEALKEFVSTILQCVGTIADKITGRETTFFDELSTLVSVDVRGWLNRARGILMEGNYTDPGNPVFATVVNKLVVDGDKLQHGINGVPRKISCDYASLVGSVMKELRELQKKICRSGCTEGRRREPAWIYVWGKRHCGKSNFMSELGIRLCQHFDLPYTVANRNIKDSFYSSYLGQTIMQIDDLSATKTEPAFEGEMLNLVSCQEHPLNMADLADKPIYFRSDFVITSSNLEDVPPSCVRDVEAYRARKCCLIEMRRKPGVQFDPDNPMTASQMRLKDPMTQMCEGPEAESWIDIEDGITEILNRVARHRDEQERLQRAHLRKTAAVDPMILAAENFLQRKVEEVYLHFPKIELEKAGLTCAEGRGLCVDGSLLMLNSRFEMDVHTVHDSNYARLWEKRTMEQFFPMVHGGTYLNGKSLIVTGFLRSLVNSECSVLGLGQLSSTATSCQQRIFQHLGLCEQAYLRCLQKRIDMYNAEVECNPYCNTAWAKVLKAMMATRDLIIDNGGGMLMIMAAILVIIVSAWGFWKALGLLFTGTISIGTFFSSAAEADLKSQSNSSGIDRGYRARNIPVNHRYAYTRSTESDGMLPAARLCVAIYTSAGDFVSAMQYKNKSIMLTRHQALRFREGERLTLIYSTDGERKMVNWHQCHMTEIHQSEIVLWTAPSLSQLPHQYAKLFLEDAEVEMPLNFKAMGYVLRNDKDGYHYDTLDTYATVDRTPLPLKDFSRGNCYSHEIPEKISFHYEARNHDCGMLILARISERYKVVGLLVAGKEKTSWACLLPNPHMAELKSSLEYLPEFGEAEEGFSKIGYVDKKDAPGIPKKTALVAVPEALLIPVNVPIKEPAVLCRDDPRCPEGVDPPMKAFKKKFTQPMLELEQELLDEVAMDILETWYDCEDHVLSDIPLEVAINGIPAGCEEQELENFVLKTSPGYPYFKENRKTHTKGKHAYFQEEEDGRMALKKNSLAEDLYLNLRDFTKQGVPELVVIECPKDELLPVRKVKEGACRLFEIMPLHYNLFLREKTCAFTQFLQNERHKLPCQVGTNPYSREWSHIFQRLAKRNSVAINCDYSGFDGLLNAQLIETMAKMINRLYALSGDTELSQAQRYNMIMALHGRYAFLGQKIYKVNAGLPSGFALTVVMNSLFNEILIRYAFKVLAPKPQRNFFGLHVTLLVYGDDNLISRTPTVEWFTGEAIRCTLAKYKVKITDGSDKLALTIEEKPLSELDFLKRKFLKTNTGVIQAPLDKSAIYSCLHWLVPSKGKKVDGGPLDVVEELILNVNVSLMELYLHDDRDEFNSVRQFYLKRLPMQADLFRTWAMCESFHSSQQTGFLKYDPAKVLDIHIAPGMSKFLHCSGEGKACHRYTPTLAVCGPHYHCNKDEFCVSTIPLKPGEDGCVIPVTSGAGVGGLPTKSWVNAFRSPRKLKNQEGYQIYSFMLGAIEAGKTLIFKSPAPYVAGNAALIAFADGAKLARQQDLLYHYRNSIPENMNGLEQYFDAPLPSATIGKFWFSNAETYANLCHRKEGEVADINTATVTTDLNAMSKLGKVPAMSARSFRSKFTVALACNKNMCPHHKATQDTMDKAFDVVWSQKCKTSNCQVSDKFGLKQ